MLWLEWEGGQLPIGWDAGPAATIPSLFGTSWKVYEGVNTGNGMTVVSGPEARWGLFEVLSKMLAL